MTVLIYGIDDDGFKVLSGSKANVYDRLAQVVASSMKDLVVTDEVDNFVLSTYGEFLDRIDPSIREEFMKYLLPYQTGEKEITEIKYDEYKED